MVIINPVLVLWRGLCCRQETELTRRVSEKANLALAIFTVLTSFGSVAGRV